MVADRHRAALAAHESQLSGTHWLSMPAETFNWLFDEETFVRYADCTRVACARGRPVCRPAGLNPSWGNRHRS